MSYVLPHPNPVTQQQPLHHTNNPYAGLPESFQRTLRTMDEQFEKAVRSGLFAFSCSQASKDEAGLYNVSDEDEPVDENVLPSLNSKLCNLALGNAQPLPIDDPVSMFYSPLPKDHPSLAGRAVFMESPVRSPDNFPPTMRYPLQERQMSGCTPALDRWSLDRSPFTPEPLSQSLGSDAPLAQNAHAQPMPDTPIQVSRRLVPEWTPGAPMKPMTPPPGRVYLAAKREGDKPPVRTRSFAFNSPAKAKKRTKQDQML